MREVKQVKANQMFPVIMEIFLNQSRVLIAVTGMSMYPFLRENIDSVELSNSSYENICYGDIVLILRESGEYVLHRVLKKEIDCFYMIGDAQMWIEGPLYPNQLIAVVTAVCRKDKKIECSNFWWKLLSLVWLKLIPFRSVLIRLYRCLGNVSGLYKNLRRRVRT
jgi:hypothetical protein